MFFAPDQVKQILEAGWGVVSYRQNTELFVQAWHWNPKGAWSDPLGKGYFRGDATPAELIRHSYGYSLQHRGFTRNGGTEFDGYSRLDDGDVNTYWKSNPYLTKAFTREDESRHPQWVVIDLGKMQEVNAVRIAWAEPYARSYEVQYWAGKGDAMDEPANGDWKRFVSGLITNAHGGTVTLPLQPSPENTKFVRLWMTESSDSCDTHGSSDRRNCVGYAIKEVYVGTVDQHGAFKDLLHHSPDQNQSLTYCSSVDPWHEPSDLYVAPDRMESGDQLGLDLLFTSGITRGLPAIVPVAMLYGTPEDSVAQMTYLKKRGYPVSYVEMGEEPDGQYMLPEDYGALYLQFATAMHRVDSNLKLGGPVFEGVNEDIKVWPDAQGRTSWLGRFLDYLKAHDRLGDLAFMSFEHYPYPPCEIVWADLYREPQLVSHILDVWRGDGLPADVPLMNTESNVTYGNAQQSSDIFAALWLADRVGAFLTAGGAVYYHSPIQPEPLRPGCRGFGTYGNYVADENLNVKTFTAQYHASRLINLEWVQHRSGVHKLYPAACELKDAGGHTLITAYAVSRPDGMWSLMIVNKDQSNAHQVRVAFDTPNKLSGPITVTTFGSEQYMWKFDGPNSHPDP